MRGEVLLELARGTLRESFGGPKVVVPEDAWLYEKKAVFVTLHKDGDLRGCVGQLAARLPLCEAVRSAAKAAAFHDGRFPPLRETELPQVHLEISVLSALEPLEAATEAEALQAIRPGVDGVVLTHGARSGVFIPEMWKQLPDPNEFLFHLKRKAGLPQAWQPGTRVERFTAEVWAE
ncbi:MAG: AmmeMemoRadiSam system protein A [Myxococcales bacterium]|nr:AmmeMemoRadiSam system protein A [Myxococcales bacterium]